MEGPRLVGAPSVCPPAAKTAAISPPGFRGVFSDIVAPWLGFCYTPDRLRASSVDWVARVAQPGLREQGRGQLGCPLPCAHWLRQGVNPYSARNDLKSSSENRIWDALIRNSAVTMTYVPLRSKLAA